VCTMNVISVDPTDELWKLYKAYVCWISLMVTRRRSNQSQVSVYNDEVTLITK